MGRRSLVVSAITTTAAIAAALVTSERPVVTQSSTATHTAVDLGTLGGASSVARGVGDLAFAIAGSSTTPSGATHAFRYRPIAGFTDLGTLGGFNSEAWAISPYNSYVAGRAKLATTKYHAFLWTEYPTGGPMVDLGTLGGSESGAYGVNDSPAVVGWSHTAGDAATRAFVYRGGRMSPLSISFGGSNSTAFAINQYDHIVGQASLAGNAVSHAFLYIDGVAKDLGSPGGTSVATAINDYDQVAGYWLAVNGASSAAFVYTGGAMQTLPKLGGSFAYARAIDAAGVVVGEADTSGGVRHAVRWRSGAIEDLNSLLASGSGWVLQAATGIDNHGNIVGYGLHNGQTRAFLLSPPVDLRLSVTAHSNQLDTNIPNPLQAGRSLDLGATVVHDATHWVTGVVITDTLTGPVEYTSWDSADVADCTRSGQTLTCHLKSPLGPGGFATDLMIRARTTGPGTITHTATARADQADPNVSNNSQSETNRILSLASFSLNSPVVGGKPALGRTTLTSPTGSGGSTIKLASSNPAVATVPSQFDVLPWSHDGLWREFYVTTQPVAQQTSVQISATYGLVTITNTLTILPSTPSTPYGGAARAVPGTLQAEDYDAGGEGVGYHDSNTANNGGWYRSDGVDIEKTSDSGGGYDVGWIRVGEWLKFTVNVAAAGTYKLEARVASAGPGGTFHIEANGVDKTGPMTVPDTGSWQSWRTVSKPVTLGAGVQVLRLAFDANGPNGAIGNINWLRLAATSGVSTPYGGVARAVPGTVQAEDFDDGGEGVAYHDTTAGNAGGAYRTKRVDIEVTADAGGGYNVGWMAAGEWLKYTVNVAAAGTYTLSARVAAEGAGGTFHVEVGGIDRTGPLTIPNTGGWQNWTTLTKTVTLPSGRQVVKVVLDANGPTGVFGNLNYLAFATAGTLSERGLEPVDHPWYGSWAAASTTAPGSWGALTPVVRPSRTEAGPTRPQPPRMAAGGTRS